MHQVNGAIYLSDLIHLTRPFLPLELTLYDLHFYLRRILLFFDTYVVEDATHKNNVLDTRMSIISNRIRHRPFKHPNAISSTTKMKKIACRTVKERGKTYSGVMVPGHPMEKTCRSKEKKNMLAAAQRYKINYDALTSMKRLKCGGTQRM
jgi:hypothetical protein